MGRCSEDISHAYSKKYLILTRRQPEKPWEEQTSTLVLTTPSSHFIDIRVYRDITQPNDPCLFLPSGTTTARLEWAFAGTSSSQMVEDQSGNPVRVCRWEHWVDSRVALGAEPQDDSGHMYELEDGTTLEKGVMKDTSTGQQTPYEELWKDMPIEATAADGSKVSILARMEGAQNSRGIIIRVGRWVQGILVKDGEVSVERWKWHEESGKFGCAVRIGRHNVPCFIAFDDESKFEIGKSLELDGMVWKVLEKYQ